MLFGQSFAILIHGYTLTTHHNWIPTNQLGNRSWKNVAWGDIGNLQMGRVLFGTYLALSHQPSIIIFGTGSSCIHRNKPISRLDWLSKGQPKDVKWEADFTLKYLIDNFEELLYFPKIAEAINQFGGLPRSKKYIKSISITETHSKNTQEEILNAVNICDEKKINILLRVTNPSHEPRCVTIQNKILKTNNERIKYFFSNPCQTDFSENEEVVVFEPQSGPGIKKPKSSCNILRSFFSLSIENKIEFLNMAELFFREHS